MTNFFVRDVSNGSTSCPFRIRPGAPDQLDLHPDVDGDVGHRHVRPG